MPNESIALFDHLQSFSCQFDGTCNFIGPISHSLVNGSPIILNAQLKISDSLLPNKLLELASLELASGHEMIVVENRFVESPGINGYFVSQPCLLDEIIKGCFRQAKEYDESGRFDVVDYHAEVLIIDQSTAKMFGLTAPESTTWSFALLMRGNVCCEIANKMISKYGGYFFHRISEPKVQQVFANWQCSAPEEKDDRPVFHNTYVVDSPEAAIGAV